jgi:NAD-dependent SIR2 family protein deacetylase
MIDIPESEKRSAPDKPTGDFVRCPTCGGKVQMPCLACRLSEGRISEQIMDLCLHPKQKPKTKKCRVCGKEKLIIQFGNETLKMAGYRTIYTTCQSCRVAVFNGTHNYPSVNMEQD